MPLSTHIRQVYYAETGVLNGQVGISIGIGLTPAGYLAAFSYQPDIDRFTATVWPTQLAADVSHQVGVTLYSHPEGEPLRLYVDGVAAPSPVAKTPVAPTNHAAIGGAWLGYDSPYTQANAHWISLGQFSWWHRILTDEQMLAVYTAGQPWTAYEFDRVTRVLDFAHWPAGWRDGLAEPHSTYQLLATPAWEVGTTALALIQRAISSVDGVIFIAADGRLTYQRMTDRDILAAPTLVFTEGDGTAVEGDFAYAVDDNDLVNTMSATTRSGLAFVRTDPDSIVRYDERAATFDCDLAHPSDVVAAVSRRINRYKAPILRCPTVTVDVAATPDATLAALDLELGDVIGLAELPLTAPADEMTVVVESIAWSIDAAAGDWKVTFEVSPGSMYSHSQFDFVLDDTSLADRTSSPRPPSHPGPPTGVSAVAGDAQVAVSFSAPADNGGAAVTSYRVTGDPAGSAEGAASPITVTGLANGTEYTFTVAAHNSAGWSSESDPSGPVTPAAGTTGIDFRSLANTTYSVRTNTTVDKPAGTAAGDVLLLLCFLYAPDNSNQDATGPAGFTLIADTAEWTFYFPCWTQSTTSPWPSVAAFGWWKVAGADEPSTYTVTHAEYISQAVLIAVSGADTTAPFAPLYPTTWNGEGTTSHAPSITTVADNSLLIFVNQDWATHTDTAVPAGGTPTFTEQLDAGVVNIDTGVLGTAGATGEVSITNANAGTDPWQTFLFSMQPGG